MHILIIDDDSIDRKVLRRAIRNTDIQTSITEASDADEGLRLLKERHFDVLILDFSMPRKNGIEMLIELKKRSHTENTAILMLTSYEDEKLVLECFDAGADDFILKADISPCMIRRSILNSRARIKKREGHKPKHRKNPQEKYRWAISDTETNELTGLTNRHLFEKNLAASFAEASENLSKVGLIMVSIKSLGADPLFNQSDEPRLMSDCVTTMQSCLHQKELLAHLDDSEFAIALYGDDAIYQANMVATRLLNNLSRPIRTDDITQRLTAKIGVAIYPDHSETLDGFLFCAREAMQEAESHDGCRVCFFNSHPEIQRPIKSSKFNLGFFSQKLI